MSKRIIVDGVVKTQRQCARDLGLSHNAIYQRMMTGKYTLEEACTKPRLSNSGRCPTKITIDGETKLLREWCEQSGVSMSKYQGRKRLGWTNEEIFLIGHKAKKTYESNGERHTLEEWSKITGKTANAIRYRIAKGLPLMNRCRVESNEMSTVEDSSTVR